MRIIKALNEKRGIVLNKNEWTSIGKKAGWLKTANQRRSIRVTFEDGNTVDTEINGTEEEIKEYYLGKKFNFGDSDEHSKDKMVKAVKVEFLDLNDLGKEAKKGIDGEDPCWDGYEMVGTKKKDGKDIPNCVPKKKKASFNHKKTVEAAKYKGEKVELNKPFRTPGGPKKFSVYVKNDKGNVVKVNFGDPNMSIKRDDPEAKKNYRARHNCQNPGPKWKANYWSCRSWSSNAPWL